MVSIPTQRCTRLRLRTNSNMKGIRNRLFASFLAVIVLLLALDISFFAMHVVLIKKYQGITNNMITEYRLMTVTDDLVNSFNGAIKSIHDPAQVAKYNSTRSEITAIFSQLDTTITNPQSRVAYTGLKNTIHNLISWLDAGIQGAETGNIVDESTYYDQALHEDDFVHQNTATLIFDELNYTEQIQAEITNDEFLSEIFGGFFLLFLSIGTIIYAVFFSKKLTAPLIDLAKLAKSIAGGNLNATVDPGLLVLKDEVGSLANSFDIMVQSLRENIYALDRKKKSVEEKIKVRTQELVEERARLLASINSLPLGFLLLDTASAVVLSNHMAQEIFPQKELTLAALGNLFAPAMDVGEFNRLMKEKQSYELQEAKLGEKSFRIMATPVVLLQPDGQEATIGSVMLMEDITQEKMLEQSKNTFLAIAAHEMRTPLTVIRGEAELMLDDSSVTADAGLKTQIESVLNGAVRLLGIVNDFLDVQNLEGGRVFLKIEPVDIVASLKDVVRDLSVLTEKKGLTLTINIPSDFSVPALDFDKGRLQQIYVNLIGNAIHYTERGGVTVSVKKEDKVVKVLFEDTGIGIDSEEQKRLFGKFETGRAFVQSREYGSGLGLYISRFLAHLMGGDLVLERSETGRGSVFCLTLPLAGAPQSGNPKKG